MTSETASKEAGANSSMNIWILASYATIFSLWAASQIILIPYVVHLLLLVTAILYASCHMSLQLRHEPHPDAVDEKGDPIVREQKDTMKKEDAMQFPLIGSLSLFSLYLAFKYLDKDWVNFLIGAYFGLVGCFAVTMTFAPAVSFVTKEKKDPKTHQIPMWFSLEKKFNHSLPEFLVGPSPLEFSIAFTLAELLSFIVGVFICALYYQWGRPWYLNNVLGICFCLQGIERFSLGTYKIGAILLIGLFFYDIFWVFGTEVMVTVAKNLDGPIKILFPRTLTPDPESGKLDLSLLGLGDIVIPGFFLSLLLRFDAHNAQVSIHHVDIHQAFPKPYFHSALAAYFAGLATTLFVMIQFKAAQPALLYLVPACLGSSLSCATMRGELKELFAYSEEEDELEEEEGKEKDAKASEPPKRDDTVQAKKED